MRWHHACLKQIKMKYSPTITTKENTMKNKMRMIAGVAAACVSFCATVQANPILTLDDGNGHTAVVPYDSLSGDATYGGNVGDWYVFVTTGIASPPALGSGTVTLPYIDLTTKDMYMGSGRQGNTLTITWTVDGLGSLAGSFVNDVSDTGFSFGSISDTFNVLVNGGNVLSTSSFGSVTVGLTAGANSTVTFQEVLTANSASATSFDHLLSSVPDGGSTAMLLGAALSAMGLLRRKLFA
jgi:VPDSG-CTERM motif